MNEEEPFEEILQKPLDKKIRTHYLNLGQGTIVTTEDRVRLCLQNAIDSLGAKRAWWTPSALLVTLTIALTTAEFKDQFAIPAATWEAIFLLSAAASLIWTVGSIWKAIRVKVSVESTVSCIKQLPTESPQERSHAGA